MSNTSNYEKELLREFRRKLLMVELAAEDLDDAFEVALTVGMSEERAHELGSVSFVAEPMRRGLWCGVMLRDACGDEVWTHSETIGQAR